ncbi:MAG: CehA/McbA family metallohydrolase [Oscillospiraceae bacterium]|nr:CehA/McbA family metallohydrolase [Oscillospiraceae bacterium]
MFRLPAGAATVYQEITGMEELTSGQYVLVTPFGDAPGILLGEDFVISATKPTFTGDTDAAGAEWDLTVTANGVILTDAHGVSAAPMEGDRNGIAAGTYEWQVLWDGEYFSFHGCNGSEPVTLVSDTLREKDFLACRDVDIEEAPDSYVSIFTLYRRMEVQDGPEPEEPEKLEEPGEVVETSPSVTVLPEGGTIRAGEEITLTCEDESADIYYAVSADGVNYQPDALYAGSICFEEDFGTAYLRAYSIAGGCEPGEVTQVIFTEEFDLDWNLYFGQLHAHTDISNGAGSVEEAFQYASQVDGLDFFAVTDHSDSFDNADMGAIDADGADISADWAAGKQAAASVTGEDFVGLFGFEMTWPEDKQLGHISTFNTPGWQTRDQADFENVPTALENYYKALTSVPGSVSQFNHPDDIHGDFERFDHYSPKYDAAVSLLEVAGEDGVVDCGYYDRALDEGWHVAPTNNQNNHKGQWGDASDARTVVLAKDLTEESLYAAMKDRRVYATQDSDLTVYYQLNGAVMGSILPKSKEAEITVFLSDPTDEAIGNVEVVTDGGAVLVSEYVETPSQVLELPASGGRSYYYLRITQPDGDVAVTAPVWMDGYDDIGIGSFTSDTLTPARDEEIGLTVELYNDEPVDFAVESLSLYADDKLVETVSKPGTVAAMDTLDYTFYYAHPELGVTEIRVEAAGSVNGEDRTYEDTLSLSFHVPEQVKRISVDASHGNSGVDKLNRLKAIAAKVNIAVDILDGELPENSDLLLITAPAEAFDEEFVEKVRTFVENGGTVILCGQSDMDDRNLHTSGELNRLLEAMGATMRLNDDTASSISTNVFNPDSGLTKSLTQEQTYTQRAGCTVNPGNGTWLVKGRDTTHGIDADADGQETGEDTVLLAGEELPGDGKVYVSGGLFLEDSAMKEPDNIWKPVSGNQRIVEALLKIERAACPELVTIGEMRSGKAGEIYHIRGWATSGTSRPGNTFSKTIYLQDDTGGVALVPFTKKEKDIKVGMPIEVVGRKEIRGGNVVLKIIDYEVQDEPLYNYTPKTTPNEDAMDYDTNGGRLMQVEGKVTDVTYTDDRKVVSRITLKDGDGDFAEILIEDGIVSGADWVNDLASRVKKGRTVRAIGILHLDSDGTPVLRVRNCDEVVYVPPVPVSLGSRRNPRTGDLIWIAVGVMVLSGIGLAVLLRKRKR